MDKERIFNLMLELCHVPSITQTYGEIEISMKIYKILIKMEYYKRNSQHLQLHKIPKDPMNRTYVTALMKGRKKSKKTVVLLSHFDVVGVEEYGPLKPYAFQPIKYTEHLKNNNLIHLSNEAFKDLESNDYLFGRGIMDMKFGIATDIEVLHQMENHLKDFDGNILFVSVPDEEGNSMGMLAAVNTMLSIKKQEDLEYVCAIISEPHFPKYPGDNNLYIYHGTVGKILPVFYCVGKETHVGEPFAGLNPNLLTAKIIEKIDQNPYLCDNFQGVNAPAPTCLKQSDIKNEYSVQTPTAAYTYFNFTTVCSTPEKILYKLKELAEEAFQEVLEDIKKKSVVFQKLTGDAPSIPEITPKILFYHELYDLCLKTHGEVFQKHIDSFITSMEVSDLRLASIELVKEIHSFCPYRDPMMIIFFAPPFYPHSPIIENEKITKICSHILEFAKDHFNTKLHLEPFFPGLSDMSYLLVPNSLEIETLQRHFPLWGKKYSIPIDIIRQLNIPFINIGPLGKDPHKYTERICLSYSLNIASSLIHEAVLKALDN